MCNNRKSFTLVEMLVVIAIIGILASMLAPSLRKAQNQAYSISCVNNQKQLGISITIYTDDNNGFWSTRRYARDTYTWADELGTYPFGSKNTGGSDQSYKIIPDYFFCPSLGIFDEKWPSSYTYGAYEVSFGTSYENEFGSPYTTKVANYSGINFKKMKKNSRYMLLADSIRLHSTNNDEIGQQGHLLAWWAGSVETGIHLRHNETATLMFGDGHVKLCDFNYMQKDLYHSKSTFSKSFYRQENYNYSYWGY